MFLWLAPFVFVLAFLGIIEGPRYVMVAGSMEPNLHMGDVVRPTMFTDERAPAAGDVVAFRAQRGAEPEAVYLMRIVGVPGDRLQMVDGALNLDGEPVEMERIGEAAGEFGRTVIRYRETLPNGATYEILDAMRGGTLDNTAVFVVPQGMYFMLGDNRDNATDSRIDRERFGIGFVARDAIIGRIEL